jgi:hypothetical protein
LTNLSVFSSQLERLDRILGARENVGRMELDGFRTCLGIGMMNRSAASFSNGADRFICDHPVNGVIELQSEECRLPGGSFSANGFLSWTSGFVAKLPVGPSNAMWDREIGN